MPLKTSRPSLLMSQIVNYPTKMKPTHTHDLGYSQNLGLGLIGKFGCALEQKQQLFVVSHFQDLRRRYSCMNLTVIEVNLLPFRLE